MDSFALIIFGITSNLAQIKLLPALYDMAEKDLLPENMVIVGNARKPMTKQEIEEYVKNVLNMENRHHKHKIKSDIFQKLVRKIHYIDGHSNDPDFYPRLEKLLNQLKSQGFHTENRVYYLATYPDLYHDIFENLKRYKMTDQKSGFKRLMIEKPIGSDLESAKKLNKLLLEYFDENQIYRLDHYLGKETLQNILTFRFGNGIFEPLMHKNYIDHIQISATEDFGIGKRGGYFDKFGMLKDVGQNHQLQMLAFATMDAPKEFSNEAVTKERIKILKSIKPKEVVFGQYSEYTKEENVQIDSDTDTFYALKCQIENDRFEGVPIYIRAGKKLKKTITEISIVFKQPENRLFKDLECGMEPNVLTYRIAPKEGIVLKILTKKPGHTLLLEEQYMQFSYRSETDQHILPDPYERLISDAIRGDQTFFNDAQEVEAQWAFIDPLFEKKHTVYEYKPGSWGPDEADQLIENDGRSWITT